jgi:glycosyltransferase involved in cell wall biosynthesis
MRILMLHNRYQIPGGEDVSTRMQVDLLRSDGHSVELVEESNERIETLGVMRTAARTIWSRESYARIDRLLEEDRFDVMHVQNFFPLLSPSVYYAARKHQVPVLQSLRNFRLVCPEGTLYRDGRICTDCLGHRIAWPGIQHACYRDSRAGTSVVAAMSSVHRAAGTWKDAVALYVTPSEFTTDMFIQAGWDPELFVSIPNFVHPDPGLGSGQGGFALFVGRLDPAKGVDTLLNAWQQGGVSYPLKIVGDGELRSVVERAAAEHPAITYVGAMPPHETSLLMGDATMVIVPTVGTETFGRVVAEAFAKGTPAVVSDVGGLPGIVDDDHTGFVVRPGDIHQLADRVAWMFEHPVEVSAMRIHAREAFVDRFSGDRALQRWLSAYQRIIEADANP